MVHQIVPETLEKPENESKKSSNETVLQHDTALKTHPMTSQNTQREEHNPRNRLPSYFLHQDDYHGRGSNLSSSIHEVRDVQRTFLSQDRRHLWEEVGLKLRRIGDQSVITMEIGRILRKIADDISVKFFLNEHELLDYVSDLDAEEGGGRLKRKNS